MSKVSRGRIWAGDLMEMEDGSICCALNNAEPGATVDIRTVSGCRKIIHADAVAAVARFSERMNRMGYTPDLLADAMFPGLRGVTPQQALENGEVIDLNRLSGK